MKNRRSNADSSWCSVNFLRYLLFIYNFIFYFAGLSILALGVWTIFGKSNYVALLANKTYTMTSYIFVAIGLICILIGVLGCISISRKSRPLVLTFACSLLVIFLLEIAVGALAYVYAKKIDSDLQRNFRHVLINDYGIKNDVTEAANHLQKTYGCCGSIDFQDWYHSVWYNKTNYGTLIGPPTSSTNQSSVSEKVLLKVPNTCCRSPKKETCGHRDHPSNIYYDGCLKILSDEIKQHSVILGATALGVSSVQLFGIVVSCILYTKLKDYVQEDEGSSRHGRIKRISNNY